MRKLFLVLLVILFSGCAAINFSSKYYKLPPDYQTEIRNVWDDIPKTSLKYKYRYIYRICADNYTKPAGIPQINGTIIYIPDYFIRYVYEFYPEHYHAIFTCLFLHEIGHTEFNLSSDTIEQHYQCDIATINNLLKSYTPYGVNEYYSLLKITEDYWQARKGMGGHIFNWGWNILSLVSVAYGGSGYFADWFANDLTARMNALRRDYSAVFVFKRIK